MRSLIRPMLFMVARLGLFFALVAWIASQWWSVDAQVGPDDLCLTLVVLPDFVGGGIESNVRSNRIEVESVEAGKGPPSIFNQDFIQRKRQQPGCFAILLPPGVILGYDTSRGIAVAIRHWINVTLFALFYGVLKWVYRKCEQTQAE